MISVRTVALTPTRAITGDLVLREQRLSDFLNDKRESVLHLSNATVARLDDPATQVAGGATVVIHKRGALVVYGLDDPTMRSTQRLYARVEKRAHDVLLIVDVLEVHGRLHTTGTLDAVEIQRLMTQPGSDRFMPVTDVVIRTGGPGPEIRQEAVMVNGQHIRFIAVEEPRK